jgi:hypothetical protein
MSSDAQSLSLRALLLAGLVATAAAAMAATPPALQNARIARNYGQLPLRFEPNRGQADPGVDFLSRGEGYTLYLTGREAVLSLRKQANQPASGLLRMQFSAAEENPLASSPVGQDSLPGVSNYLIGADPAQWRTDVPAYGKVRYTQVYPGVDLVFYGNGRQLEYDFLVAPGANPDSIRLHFDGARSLRLKAGGDLEIDAVGGPIAFRKPEVYQIVHGKRSPVAGHFTLMADNSASFALGRYDRSRPLVIDPTLVYSTYLGGSIQDSVAAIALDASGEAFLTGTTSSTDYPVTPGAVDTIYKNSHSTAFVTKLNASGTALIYSTFLGGSGTSFGGDTGQQIAVDSTGEAYAVGSTCSTDFPVTPSAYQSANKAAVHSACTGYFSKLNAAGTKLLYSTYLGGSSTDTPTSLALALDATGDVLVAGSAYSSDFPTTAGVVQTTNKSAPDYGWNEFVAKINPSASGPASLLYSTYLGGSKDYGSPDKIRVAVDKSGDAYVSGIALSTDFPVTSGAYQTKNNAAAGHSDMTLSELNPTATKLLYSTYLGGSGNAYGDDVANGLAVDSTGNAYLTGTTYEINFPVTKGAYQTTSSAVANSLSAGFVTKMSPTGTALVYSTYLGGSGGLSGDRAWAVALDTSGDAFITGSADSTDFPVTGNAYQKTNPAAFNNGAVVFLTEFNPAGSALVYSTYFGGANSFGDTGYGISLGSGGAVYLAGFTGASNFPITPGAYNSTFNSQYYTMGFVAKFIMGTAPATLPTVTALVVNSNPAVTGTNMIFTAGVAPVTGTGIATGSVVFSLDETVAATVALTATGSATWTTAPFSPGLHYVLASYTGSTAYAPSGGGITETITPAIPIISPPGGTYQSAQLVTLAAPTAGSVLHFTTDGKVPTTSSTAYSGPLMVSTLQTIRAIASIPGLPSSSVASASYTLLNAPTVLAAPASSIATPKATLNALAGTYGMAGSYYFQYGLTSTALTSSTPKAALGGSSLGSRLGFVPVQVSAQLTALLGKTTYYYRVVVTTAAGTSSGKVLSFTTN